LLDLTNDGRLCGATCPTGGIAGRWELGDAMTIFLQVPCGIDRIRRGFAAAAFACVTLGTVGAAQATGFFINQQSVSGLGRADAGDAAAAQDASTVFYNPAGMTELWRDADPSRDTILQSGMHIIIPQSHLSNGGSTATTPGSGGVPVSYPGSDAIDPGLTSPVGNAYIVHRLLSGAAYVGLGITSPFGLAGQNRSDWFGRYDNLKATLQTINIAPVVAVPINSYLSAGGGIDIQYQKSVLSLAIPNPLAPGGPSTATDGHFDVRGDAWAVGYNIGILVKPTPALRFGVHYRSAVDHTLVGTATTSGFNGLLSSLNTSAGASAVSKLPNIVTSGAVYEIDPKLSLFGEVSWYGWSRLGATSVQFDNGNPPLVVPGGFRDTYALGIGAEYRWSEELTLRTGFRFDRTPTEDQFRNTSFADANRYWLAGGATYKMSEAVRIDFAFVHVIENGTHVDVTRTSFDESVLASSVNVRANVHSSVTTVSAAFNYRF
jgi:long-chain fatty acid transport protein